MPPANSTISTQKTLRTLAILTIKTQKLYASPGKNAIDFICILTKIYVL